jgi:hypothetical protein
VHVDESRRDDSPRGIDPRRCRRFLVASVEDVDDTVARYDDRTRALRGAGAVDDQRVGDDEIVHRVSR